MKTILFLGLLVLLCSLADCGGGKKDSCKGDDDDKKDCDNDDDMDSKIKILLSVICILVIIIVVITVVLCCYCKKKKEKKVSDIHLGQEHTQNQPPPYSYPAPPAYATGSNDQQAGPLPAKY